MVITLTGANDFGIKQTLLVIVDNFVAQNGAEGVEKIAAEDIDAQKLPDLLQGATLFAPQRLVVLKDISANKPLADVLVDHLPSVSGDITLVIVDPALDKRTRLYKWLRTNSDFREIGVLAGGELAAWVRSEAKLLGAEISDDAVRSLLQRTGSDQWRLNNEIQKLASFDRKISVDSINLLVEPTAEGNAFELLDAVIKGDTRTTEKLIGQLKGEEDPYKLFGLLVSQVQAIATVAAAGERSLDQVAKDSGLHPFVLRKVQPVAKRYGQAGVRRIVMDVANCDDLMKSSGHDPWELLKITMLKIASHRYHL